MADDRKTDPGSDRTPTASVPHRQNQPVGPVKGDKKTGPPKISFGTIRWFIILTVLAIWVLPSILHTSGCQSGSSITVIDDQVQIEQLQQVYSQIVRSASGTLRSTQSYYVGTGVEVREGDLIIARSYGGIKYRVGDRDFCVYNSHGGREWPVTGPEGWHESPFKQNWFWPPTSQYKLPKANIGCLAGVIASKTVPDKHGRPQTVGTHTKHFAWGSRIDNANPEYVAFIAPCSGTFRLFMNERWNSEGWASISKDVPGYTWSLDVRRRPGWNS